MDYVIGHAANIVWIGLNDIAAGVTAMVEQQTEFASLLFWRQELPSSAVKSYDSMDVVNKIGDEDEEFNTFKFFVNQLNHLTGVVTSPTANTTLSVEYLTYAISCSMFRKNAVYELYRPGLDFLVELCGELKELMRKKLPVLIEHFDRIGVSSTYNTTYIQGFLLSCAPKSVQIKPLSLLLD